ncbi:hypothetical protein N7520_008963 [Penicillium odoratum]|uniref:uncharacterized protein n=1 Tax=Penicillium odoratum TaxID=1167516 RepID=UPI002546A8A4|nr:uncharacterized protein N7520_008963 [Penicillium odoratum]KAJ5752046.1 hypothetical protein N7520_008963 [Penicillium odoratum]
MTTVFMEKYDWTSDISVGPTEPFSGLVPIMGMVPFGLGLMDLYMPSQTYVIDSHPEYAAAANATLTTVRSLAGVLLAGPK